MSETCVTQFLVPSRFVKQKLVENGWPAGKISVQPHFQNLPSQTVSDPLPDAPILYFGNPGGEISVVDVDVLHSPGLQFLRVAGAEQSV